LASPVHIPHLHGIELSELEDFRTIKHIFTIKKKNKRKKDIEEGNCNSFPAYHVHQESKQKHYIEESKRHKKNNLSLQLLNESHGHNCGNYF
jgi:hypothetical protein